MCIHPDINGCVLDDGGLASVCDGTYPRAAFPSFWDHEVLPGTPSQSLYSWKKILWKPDYSILDYLCG